MKNVLKKTKIWGSLLLAFLQTIPFFVAALHANYASDDFRFVYFIKSNWTGTMLSTAVDMSIMRWHTMEGRWFACFYDVFFHPYFWKGTTTMHLLFVAMLALSFLGLLLFCFGLVKYVGLKVEKTSILFLLLLFSVTAYTEYHEVYLWFVGSIYQLTTMLFLWGFAFLLLAVSYNIRFMYIVSGIILVCMGGCMYNFVAVGCLAIFLLLLSDYLRNNKINIPVLIVFVLTSISSLLTLFAPGNFIRNNSEDGKITLIEAIVTSFKVYGSELYNYLFKTTFVGVALIIFLFGMKQTVRLKKNILPYLLIIQFLMIYASILPFVYGYNVRNINLECNRAQYLIDVTTVVSSLVIIFLMGMMTDKRKRYEVKVEVIMLFSVIIFGTSLSDNISSKIMVNYLNGSAKAYNDYWIDVFTICERSEGKDVIIEEKSPDRVEGTTFRYLKADPTYIKNQGVIMMYNIKGISILGEDRTNEEIFSRY